MSALPRDANQRGPGRETELLVDALQSAAKAREQVSVRDERIRLAIEESLEELIYRWQTPDDREAEMQVYYRRSEDVDYVAGQLLRIDYRSPTVQERARYEDHFDAEMAAAGDLWLDVASHI